MLANLLWHMGRGIAQARRLVGRPASPAHEGEARDLWIKRLRPARPRRAPHELPGAARGALKETTP